MGEIAEMMLEGTLCEGCGTYMEGDAQGFLRYCSAQYSRDRGVPVTPAKRAQPGPNSTKMNCPHCGKRLKKAGLNDHIRDVHAELFV